MPVRTIDQIIETDAISWAMMPHEQMRAEYEAMRQHIIVCRKQFELWTPFVAWRHRYQEKLKSLANLLRAEDILGSEFLDDLVAHTEPLLNDLRKRGIYVNEEQIDAAAKLIVYDIQRDFTDRRGFRQQWDATDSETKNEIIETWRSTVRNRLKDVLFATKTDE